MCPIPRPPSLCPAPPGARPVGRDRSARPASAQCVRPRRLDRVLVHVRRPVPRLRTPRACRRAPRHPASWRAPNPGGPRCGLDGLPRASPELHPDQLEPSRWIRGVLRRRFRRVRLCRRGDPAPARRPSRLRGAHRHGAPERRPSRSLAVQPHLRHLHAPRRCGRPPRETLAGHDVRVPRPCRAGPPAPSPRELRPRRLVIDCGADHRLERPGDWAAFYGGDTTAPGPTAFPSWSTRPAGNAAATELTGAAPASPPRAATSPRSPSSLAPGIARGRGRGPTTSSRCSRSARRAPARASSPDLLASEILGSASPYWVGGVHRHNPEIPQNLAVPRARPGPTHLVHAGARADVARHPRHLDGPARARRGCRRRPRRLGRRPTPASRSCTLLPAGSSSRARPTSLGANTCAHRAGGRRARRPGGRGDRPRQPRQGHRGCRHPVRQHRARPAPRPPACP